MTEISVVIPHFDDLEQLSLCLDLLDRQTLDQSRFEVIIADNNSTCGLAAVERVARGRARVISAPEPGAGPARNAGAQIAGGDAFAFIDSDCRPSPDWLRSGLEALREHPIVGGPVIIVPADPENASPEEAFDVVFGFNAVQFLEEHGFLGSGNLFVRREVFERVGGFRSGVSEDVDWSHRATAAGYALAHVPGAVVFHPARRGWEELARKWEKHTRETYLLTRERRFGRLRWIVQSWAVLLSPVAHIPRVFSCPHLHSWRDRRAAARVLFRIRAYRFIQSYRIMRAIGRAAIPSDSAVSDRLAAVRPNSPNR